MADTSNPKASPADIVKAISPESRTALHKLAAPQAVSVMEDILTAACDNNNNNNNTGNGGSGCAGRAGLSREQLLQKIGNSMSEAQLQTLLKGHGII